jgi:hypothetical protein
MENVDNDDSIGRGFDRINASYFDEAGNRVSGLLLEEIGLSGHSVANTLWRISSYLRERAERDFTYDPYPRKIKNTKDIARYEPDSGE